MWRDLKIMADKAGRRGIAPLFGDGRAEDFSVRADGMLLDYSKTAIDAEARAALLAEAEARGVPARREAMFTGAHINQTEDRAVLHTALRNLGGAPVIADGEDVMPGVLDTLARMKGFADAVRSGALRGAGGAITDVVNIGIGGSHLGPEMTVRALAPYADGPRCHFVSNIDGADITAALDGLDPARTLILVASKTFTTTETMTNAATARRWMERSVDDPGAQFVALSSAVDKAAEWGIDPARVFGFEDWVGGRYSIWGPIGLSLMIAIGSDAFTEFLRGAEAMDIHFRTAPLDANMPVMLALVGLWHTHACGYPTRAVLPYDQRLGRLPAYLQQLEMESNGKGVAMDGCSLTYPSGPVVWGEPGTNGQHAFYQLIHQGTAVIPCEFLIAARGHEPELAHHHRLLVANCLAQSKALMRGRSLEEARALMRAEGYRGAALEQQARHRMFPGGRPSTTLIYDLLTPYRLGQIIALYEHRVFVEGVMLGINSFDQWGVELGKVLATDLQAVLDGAAPLADKDGSTRQLVTFVQSYSG
ncbi:glucose-6-phosphate isomerase [Pelagivirga sediminicola]|uniref:Glucose-6-phosphate isomerase n=1 Tax=Pelagivirga sediminicola TaxID=2170575 RepID=A0A2T7GAR2_9RHOB|nr:glucose-6-phosphate isomerase [Pelagivirga sediminicola]PVA11493.1 glucose-6-phosphate isomerase [Pelagivirga sediminicola]